MEFPVPVLAKELALACTKSSNPSGQIIQSGDIAL
jgi:hypothetical protein